MNNELKKAFELLEHRHETMKFLVDSNKQFSSDYMKGITEGGKQAVQYYGAEIEKIRQLLDGFMIDDVDLTGGEKHVS